MGLDRISFIAGVMIIPATALLMPQNTEILQGQMGLDGRVFYFVFMKLRLVLPIGILAHYYS